MTGGKIAAQSVHAVLGLASLHAWSPAMLFWASQLTCVVLEASDKKYDEEKARQEAAGNPVYYFRDAGYTEVEAGTETCMAFLEDDPREANGDPTTVNP